MRWWSYNPYRRAVDNIAAMADIGPVSSWLRRRAAAAPKAAHEAMLVAVVNWHAEAIRHMPVRASRNQRQKNAGAKGPLYRRVGRGQLQKRTQIFMRLAGDKIQGGLLSGADYAIWLLAGTRHIAGGDVMRWRPGQPPISTWPAKRAGGKPEALLPIIIPWHRPARDEFVRELKARI